VTLQFELPDAGYEYEAPSADETQFWWTNLYVRPKQYIRNINNRERRRNRKCVSGTLYYKYNT
jgi:hypothetical protein